MAALRGALAAAVTPLRDGGRALDEEAWPGYVDFLAAAGLDGVLALGTTGEGILFSVEERMRVVEQVLEASSGRLLVAAHCGAQTTADTVALCEHAAAAGVDAVAVIGPPYFKLDARRPARASARRRPSLRADAALRLRVRGDSRVRARRRRARPPQGRGVERRRAEGLRHAVGGLRALPPRRLGRLRRAGGADLRGDGAWRDRRRLGTGRGVPGGGRRRRARADGGRLGAARRAARLRRALPAPRRAQARARPQGRRRCGRTCAARCGSSPAEERDELDAWLDGLP